MDFSIWAFSSILVYSIKIDLSGNTVWPQALGFPKLAKMDHFGHSSWTFVRSKCKGSSLRWQCWMRLWGRFSHNMVMMRSSPSFRMLSQFCRIPFTTSRPPKKRSGRAASSRFFGPMLALGNIARYYFPCFKAAAAAAATGQYFIERRNLRPLSSLLENWALGLLWAPWTVVPFSLLRGVQASFELENEAVKTPCLKITEKVAFVYILSGQKLIKNGLFWRVFENSVTRQVNFNRTKIGGKCPNWKTQMRHFGWFSNAVVLGEVGWGDFSTSLDF